MIELSQRGGVEVGRSQSKSNRLKAERSGLINPEISRNQWHRKPQTQVLRNMKAEQRRSLCRNKGMDEGAVYFPIMRRVDPFLISWRQGQPSYIELPVQVLGFAVCGLAAGIGALPSRRCA
jgi:hypothetical protein